MTRMPTATLTPSESELGWLAGALGLGVAGNFAGHLEQAGEARDFVGVQTAEERAPKGIFPFYVPGAGDHFLGTFPLSSHTLSLPATAHDVQMEPELALLCRVEYAAGRVTHVVPERFGAYDDTSIRRPDAQKISEKKNWGPASKGLSADLLPLDSLSRGGTLDRFRLACFLVRDAELIEYGVESAIASYTYFHERLLSWLIDRMNEQASVGPLESIRDWIAVAGHPELALVSVGATRYTPFGERGYLREGDEALVAVYDPAEHTAAELRRRLTERRDAGPGLSVLRRLVVAAPGGRESPLAAQR